MFLEQNAANKADPLEATFEMAVMRFVKGDFRTAAQQLQRTQVRMQVLVWGAAPHEG